MLGEQLLGGYGPHLLQSRLDVVELVSIGVTKNYLYFAVGREDGHLVIIVV